MAAPSPKGAADDGTPECTPLGTDRLAEIFLGNSRAGSDLDDAAKDASIGLQHGVPVDVIRNALLSDTRRGSSSLGGAVTHAGAVVLDPRDPMQQARALLAARFTDQQHRRLLHRHRGTFWRFQDNHYALANQEVVRAAAWRFLERAQRRGATKVKSTVWMHKQPHERSLSVNGFSLQLQTTSPAVLARSRGPPAKQIAHRRSGTIPSGRRCLGFSPNNCLMEISWLP
jgi:hypothetical protein